MNQNVILENNRFLEISRAHVESFNFVVEKGLKYLTEIPKVITESGVSSNFI